MPVVGDGIEMLGVVAVVLALVAILLWRQAAAGRAELRRVRGLADRESERFASLVSGSPAGIYQIDSEGRVVFANPAWRQMAGFGPDEDVGNEWAQRIHPDDLAQMAEWQRQAREGAATIESAFRFIRPGGEERWFEGRTAALPADDGAVAGFIGTIIDVTERERTRIRLGESERLHRAIVDGAVEAFVMTDRDGVIVAVNPAAKVMFAVREGDVEGQHLATLIPGITEMVTHAPRRMEARRSDGRTVMVDVSISFAHTRDARFTAIARDVTAEVKSWLTPLMSGANSLTIASFPLM